MVIYAGFLTWMLASFKSAAGNESIEKIEDTLQKITNELEKMERKMEKIEKYEQAQTALVEVQMHKSDIRADNQQTQPDDRPPVVFPPEIKFSRGGQIGLLMISCNRPDISKALDAIIRYRPKGNFPIIVSQDCGHEDTARVVQKYDHDVIHIRQPDLGPIHDLPASHKHFEGYYKISRHYKWALSEVFDALMFEQVIILEDDLEISPDFFNYFEAMLPLLLTDKSLYCISAWNDNGKQQYISDPEAVYRSDFFPGLGWMMTKEVWQELGPKWPAGFWDDWIRAPEQRRDRACIRPEISRTYTFGKMGASGGQFFDSHLKFIVLNSKFVDFKAKDLDYLRKGNYDKEFLDRVYSSELIGRHDLLSIPEGSKKSVRIEYGNNGDFESIANQLRLMADFKAGVPRGAYFGVVPFKYRGCQAYLAPRRPWNGYVE